MKRQSQPVSRPIGSSSFSSFQICLKEAATVLPKLGTMTKQPRKLSILPVKNQLYCLSVVLLRPDSPVYAGLDSEMEVLLREIEDKERSMPLARSQSESRTDKQAKGRQTRTNRKLGRVAQASRKSVQPKRYSEDNKRLLHTPAFGLRSGLHHSAKDKKHTATAVTTLPRVVKESEGQTGIPLKFQSRKTILRS